VKKLIVTTIVEQLPEVEAIYLFGSMDTRYQTEQSDVDVAILCKRKLKPLERWELAESIAKKLKRDVDLIDLNQAPIVFKNEIITSGKLINISAPRGGVFISICISPARNKFARRRLKGSSWLPLRIPIACRFPRQAAG